MERIQNAKISRRDFLKSTAAAAAAVTLAGCSQAGNSGTTLAETEGAGTSAAASTAASNEAVTAAAEDGQMAEATIHATDQAILDGKGEWLPAACWHNCGGRCMNYAYVVDNTVLRMKSDDSHEDSWEYPQQRACLRGHAQRMQIFGADRIKYPMKRKNWSLDDPHPELRGKDEWERITWNEAIELAAEALKKTYDTYGAKSVMSMAWGGECNSGGRSQNVLNSLGGAVTTWSTSSCGTYAYPWDKLIGLPSAYDMGMAEDRLDMPKTELIVLHGMNTGWSASALRSYTLLKCKEAGVKFIVIGPDYNATAQMLDAEWIPVNGGTDTAFMLGVAYAMLEADDPEKNPLIDWDFLNRCTVGFDAEHMPADAKTEENFKDYLLGAYDDTPKTPEWAEKICGAPADKIRWYAEQIGMKNKVYLLHGYAPARCAGAEDFPQMFMTLGAMSGHMGKDGHCVACGYKNQLNNGKTLVSAGWDQIPYIDNEVDDCINDTELWRAVDTGTYNFNNKTGYASAISPAEPRSIEIHAIYIEDKSGLNGFTGLAEGLKTITKKDSTVDVILTNSYNYRLEARYADIVFPVTTLWEREGRPMDVTMDREYMIFTGKVVEPQFEAKSDQEVGVLLAKKLGLNAEELYPVSEKQEFFNTLQGAEVYEDGDYVPLVTITEDDLKEWGVEGEAQEGKIGLNELRKQGIYQIPRKENDGTGATAYKEFREDPEGNPMASVSGKLEIYSQSKADNLNATGIGGIEFKPYPSHVFAQQSYENTFSDFDKQEKGEYPYLAWNPHYLRRTHSIMDSNIWLREVCENPVFLSKKDADDKGIKTGDTVRIWNRFGSVLRNALVTGTVKPGMVGIPHGTWTQMDENGNDMSGTDNILCGGSTSNSGVSGYNNYTCNIEKYTEQMESDSDRGILTPGLD